MPPLKAEHKALRTGEDLHIKPEYRDAKARAEANAAAAEAADKKKPVTPQEPPPGLDKPSGVTAAVDQGDGTARRLKADSSEADYLIQQAEDAKAAIGRALGQFVTNLGQGVNPLEWYHRFPWATMGASAVAGFVATAMMVPSKEEQALRKLAAIERALNPAPPPPKKDAMEDIDGKTGAQAYKTGQRGILGSIMGEVIGAIKPAVVSLLSAGVAGSVAKPSPSEMQAAAVAQQHGPGQGAGPGPDSGGPAGAA